MIGEMATTSPRPTTITLYDLISALNDQVGSWEEDIVIYTMVVICNCSYLRFLNIPPEYQVVCAE